jgi:hypothetical protein
MATSSFIKGGGLNKRINAIGKNEIIHEYLYDSEEEALKVNTDDVLEAYGQGIKAGLVK